MNGAITLLLASDFIPYISGGLEHLFFHVLGIVTPTDKLILFRGVGIPPTRYIFPCSFLMGWLIHSHGSARQDIYILTKSLGTAWCHMVSLGPWRVMFYRTSWFVKPPKSSWWFEPIPSPIHIKHPLNETMVFWWEFPHSIGTIINECYHNMQLGCEKKVMGFFTLYLVNISYLS